MGHKKSLFFTLNDPKLSCGIKVLLHATIIILCAIRDIIVTTAKISKVVLILHGEKVETLVSWFKWALHHSHQALKTHIYHITLIPFSLGIPLPTNYLYFKTNRAFQDHHGAPINPS